MTTIERRPRVEVVLPARYRPPSTAMIDLARVVKAHTRKVKQLLLRAWAGRVQASDSAACPRSTSGGTSAPSRSNPSPTVSPCCER